MEYGRDVLAHDPHRRQIPEVTLQRGMVVEVLGDSFVGEVVAVRGGRLVLKDRRGRERSFGLDAGGFMVADRLVRLRVPEPTARPSAQAGAGSTVGSLPRSTVGSLPRSTVGSLPRSTVGSLPRSTASGSIRVSHEARVARPSRICVEGTHDAELLEKIWGDDLRYEGIVVEVLDGVDDLVGVVEAFRPTRQRRLGILVDHLVPGTKEHRIATAVRNPHALVVGHPFVDVWAAVKPHVVGLDAWPDIPRGRPWKEGICEVFGEDEPGVLWRRILGSVTTYTDLDRSLVGAVEQLLDFLTEPE